jgi:glutamyl-tRNA synthetase
MSNKIRLRFAPSPTGYLHIGSLRTVLFDYFAAKTLDGDFILRIEDTDQKREVEGTVENLIEVLNKFNIRFDEGPGAINTHLIRGDGGVKDVGKFGPYIQSKRLDIYKKYTDKILELDGAYPCFCTSERLEKMRADQQAKKLPPRYDRACRDLSKKEVEVKIKNNEKFVIRQKMPLSGEIVIRDEIKGDIKFKIADLDDHVLIKSNGIPTYQFANVVDDREMQISHVLRGDEWIPSFPKNILLYKAFGWTPPKYIHLPLVLDKTGGKLSKRGNDVAVEDYLAKGYLPEAIINFCILLGWHPKGDDEILSVERLLEEFNIYDMGTSPAVFDIEKLDYFNGYYIRQKPLDELTELCLPYLIDAGLVERVTSYELQVTNNNKKIKIDYIKNIVRLEQERLKKLSEIGELTEFFFVDKLEFPEELLAWKKLTVEQAKENLKIIHELLEKIPEENWTNDSIEEGIMNYLNLKELKVGEYLWPMRVALTGRKASPSPFDVAEVLGKGESLKRIRVLI